MKNVSKIKKETVRMATLILGHSGFIGQSISKIFKQDKEKVIEISSKEINFLSSNSVKSLTSQLSIDTTVIMLIGIKKQYGDNLENWIKNEKILQNFVKAITKKPPKHLIYFSSASIYGEDINFKKEIKETTNPSFRTLYGISKFNNENILKKVCDDYHIPLMLLRPPLIYGHNDLSLGYGPTLFTYKTIKKELIDLWGDGKEKREFIYVDDLAFLCREIIKKRARGILNTISGISYTFLDIILELEKIMGTKIDIRYKKRTKDKVDHFFSPKIHHKMFPKFRYTNLNAGLKKLALNFEDKLK